MASTVIRYFQRLRNVNIHESGIRIKKVVRLNMVASMPLNIRTRVQITKLDANGNEIEVTRSVQKSDTHLPESPSFTKPSTRDYSIRFDDWDGEENVLTLSQKYIEELRSFINKARQINLID